MPEGRRGRLILIGITGVDFVRKILILNDIALDCLGQAERSYVHHSGNGAADS
jgi:hypothetical protein